MYHEDTWRSRVLIPLWSIQIALQFLTVISLAALMALETGVLNAVPSSDVVFMVFLILTLIANPVEILLKSLRALEPSIYLSSQVFKTLFTMAFIADETYRYFNAKDRSLSPLNEATGFVWMLIVDAGMGVLLMLSFGASLGYGIVIVRRNHKDQAFNPEKDRVGHQ